MRTSSAARAVAVAALLMLGAGCAGSHATLKLARSTAPAAPAPGGMFGQAFLHPDLTVADGSLYVSWELSPMSPAAKLPPRMALARADAATGRILAENEFSPGYVSVPLYAAGSLWVTDAAPAGELLLRLDPGTLMVTGELKVADRYPGSGADGHVAFAGNSIWVDGVDRLLQVSPGSAESMQIVPLPGAASSNVGASPDGRTLIVSEADNQGAGTIQRRNPWTGTLLASHPVLGVFAPLISGVTSASAWVAQPSGMMGYVERFQTTAMTPDTSTQVEGTNAIRVGIWDGVLWVHSQDGGTATNYCADPGTGRRLAALAMPDLSKDTLLAVSGRDLYYSYYMTGGHMSRIAAAPVPPGCLGGRYNG